MMVLGLKKRLICLDKVQCYFGHRGKFKTSNFNYEKSALSMHIFNEHVSTFDEKLDNFEMGIIKQVKQCMLDRAEDFYIYYTKSDIYGINRHKVIK